MKREDNNLIVAVGPSTPGGRMLRRYWHPIALSSQVPAPDCPPLATKLLGERFVVFRDSAGKVGILAERCMHRGVSLALGRVEEGGIRCIYHGWKYDAQGNLLDTPNDPSRTYVCKAKQPAFPVRESSGLIWTYIGPPAQQPPFREFIFDKVPAENRIATRGNVKASYLTMWEGGADSSHVGILHTNFVRPNWARRRRGEATTADLWDGLAPTYAAEDTAYGYRYVAFRPVPGREDKVQIRISPELMPGIRVLAGEKGDVPFDLALFETPMDDHETATFSVYYSASCPITKHADFVKKMVGMTDDVFDPLTHNLNMSWPDDIRQDREAMGRDNWSGYHSIKPEDLAMSLSLGEDWDRTTENLVQADIAVVRLRRMILRAIEANESGGDPPGLQLTDLSQVHASFQAIGKDEDWKAH
jgi:phenylpropionate dioxygenase-like ring-hydroxylating dioxygenase large terminal subunit